MKNLLVIMTILAICALAINLWITSNHKPHNPYTQWPNAVNTLEEEKKIDCPNGEIVWIAQSDAYGNDTSFPVCSDQLN